MADDFNRRRIAGDVVLDVAQEGGNDRETTASDVISNILTALFGAAGYDDPFRGEGGVRYDLARMERAQALLDRAYNSWWGDAEDYDENDFNALRS